MPTKSSNFSAKLFLKWKKIVFFLNLPVEKKRRSLRVSDLMIRCAFVVTRLSRICRRRISHHATVCVSITPANERMLTGGGLYYGVIDKKGKRHTVFFLFSYILSPFTACVDTLLHVEREIRWDGTCVWAHKNLQSPTTSRANTGREDKGSIRGWLHLWGWWWLCEQS
jgi:hypothetical protein